MDKIGLGGAGVWIGGYETMASAANTGNRILVGLLAGAAVLAAAVRPDASPANQPIPADQPARGDLAVAGERAIQAALATTIRRPTIDPIDLDQLFSAPLEPVGEPAIGTIEIPDEIVWLVEDVRCEIDDLRARWLTGDLAGSARAHAIDLADRLEHAQWTASTLAASRAGSLVEELAGLGAEADRLLSEAGGLLTDAAMSRGAAATAATLEGALARLDEARAIARRALSFDGLFPATQNPVRAMARAAELAWAAIDWSGEAAAQLRGRTTAAAEHWSLRIALVGGWADGMSERIATGLAGPTDDAQVWLVLAALSVRPLQPAPEIVEPAFASPPTLATTRREPTMTPDEPLHPHAPAESFFDGMPGLDQQH